MLVKTDTNKQDIQLLKKHIEQMVGQAITTPKEFNQLAEQIFKRIHVQISATTLKRIWGYLNEPIAPRTSTLNFLAQFLGYSNLETFRENTMCQPDLQSKLVFNRTISSEQLPMGTHIRLTWQPERVCEIIHKGQGQFSVIRAEKTKLQIGDTFKCKLFIEKEPLYLYDLIHQGQEIPAYIAGKKDGIYFELIH